MVSLLTRLVDNLNYPVMSQLTPRVDSLNYPAMSPSTYHDASLHSILLHVTTSHFPCVPSRDHASITFQHHPSILCLEIEPLILRIAQGSIPNTHSSLQSTSLG